MTLIIEPLNPEHVTANFESGQSTLDDFLHKYATINENSGHSRTFILREDAIPDVLGYHSLSTTSIQRDSLPKKLARRWPVNATRNGRSRAGRNGRCINGHFRVGSGLGNPVGRRPEDQECIRTWSNGVRFAVSF